MKCPVCKETDLVMTDRQGVEIDYCPPCRGVWLDRGELDKIIERSASGLSVVSSPTPPPHAQPHYGGHPPSYQDHRGHHDKHGNYRRKSWLEELFD